MPLLVRSTTLTAACSQSGISVFTKTSDGYIREARNTISNQVLAQALQTNNIEVLSHSAGWYPGNLDFQCSPDSTLCAVSWSDTAQSLFYQDIRGVIREVRSDGAEWEATIFEQPGALAGTNIAAVHSEDGSRVALFFQNNDGLICYRIATGLGALNNWRWSEAAVPIVNMKAVKGCGIGVTAWNDLDEIRVFFQDEKKFVREFRGRFGRREWEPTGFARKYNLHVGDITAVSWLNGNNIDMRLYLQNERNDIVELTCDNAGWGPGDFQELALPNADVIAFVRTINTGTGVVNCLNIFWAGQDQNIYQRISYIESQTHRWLEPVAVASISSAGDRAGSWIGSYFSDESSDIEDKFVRKVRVRIEECIVALSMDYTDGTSTAWSGGSRGQTAEFVLEDNEDIIQVWYVADHQRIRALRFGTSNNRKSQWFGVVTNETPDVWTHDGDALAGFCGTVGGDSVLGLMPIWSERATLSTIEEMVQEAEMLQLEIKALSTADLPDVERKIKSLTVDIQTGFRDGARGAMDSIVKLAVSTEYLHDLTLAARKARLGVDVQRRKHITEQLATCKEQTKFLLDSVRTMSEKSQTLFKTSEGLNAQASEIDVQARSKKARLDRLLQSTKSRRIIADEENEDLRIWIAEAENEVRKAREHLDDLERKSSWSPAVERDPNGLNKFKFRDSLRSRMTMDKPNPKAYSAAQELLKERQSELQRRSEVLKDGTRLMQNLEQASSLADLSFRDIDVKIKELRVLVAEEKKLAEASGKLAVMLQKLLRSGEAMDDNTTAVEFGEELLVVLKDALHIDFLRAQLTVDPGLLEGTLQSIASAV